ncbi:MAG: phosphatase PAP2 family protein [Candidatus Limivicinus sp.]
MELTAAALWLNTTFAAFDQSITLLVHQLYTMAGGFFTPFFEFISLLGKDGIFLVLLSLALMFYRPTRRFGTAMLFGVAIGALFTNVFLKVLIARPRPYADESSIFYQLWLLVGQNVESDKSFPSGHTTAAFSTMTALFLMGNKKYSWTAFIFAFLMGLARIYLVVHFPSDVLGGIIVGLVAGCLGALIANKLPEGWYGSWNKKKKAGDGECSDLES